ncbi:alpha/beta hydrolase [Actinoplanes sp. TBRC 11911]|uniref:alpha/beta fold hydrolase n=1 Tax=Actinoplanes sp. TBRC 11911 TaxID=2729386 RepID=UPI00145C93CD|nr:alpha/beta hydrolase [Actinoplanes sp. TBRC 11911]NMO49742.1 alpha/beta hydrolase [Actinoplanes sp. TBRC 11911]
MPLFDALSGTLTGLPDDRPPLVLLHGLTFDRRHWGPLLRELQVLEPARLALALDLPGHGASPVQDSYRAADVATQVHCAVTAAGLPAPAIVGHGVGAAVATAYAARYPVHSVLNIDQALLPDNAIRDAGPGLRGGHWRDAWDGILAGLGAQRLPAPARSLVSRAGRPRKELLLGYYDEALTEDDDAIRGERGRDLHAIAGNGVGYRWVTASEPPVAYRKWMTSHLPRVDVMVLPDSHFPHLARPADIARLVAAR